jgi:hypothetical protein
MNMKFGRHTGLGWFQRKMRNMETTARFSDSGEGRPIISISVLTSDPTWFTLVFWLDNRQELWKTEATHISDKELRQAWNQLIGSEESSTEEQVRLLRRFRRLLASRNIHVDMPSPPDTILMREITGEA